MKMDQLFSQHSFTIPGSVSEIPRVSNKELTAAQFFTTYRQRSQPVVITGWLEGDAEWNLDYLCQQLGDRQFPVRFYGQERYQQDKRQWTDMGSGVKTASLPFVEYAKLLQDGQAREQDMYLGKVNLANTTLAAAPIFQRVADQLNLTVPVSGLNLWCGLGGHTTCLHCDSFDGTLIQLHGSKRILLFPPHQLPNLYPFSIWNHLRYGLKLRSSYSQVYPDRPDFAAFPKFRQALAHHYVVTLNAGDVLFIPVGWWHEVSALGEGMVCSVNRFWKVDPVWRSLSWNKWRIHVATLLAAPHVLMAAGSAVLSGDREQRLKQLMQKL
jgi:hypothetical protein